MDVESNELSKLGAEALRDLYNNLAGVKQFALEQAPDVCQQMIQWEIAQGVAAVACWVVVCVGCAVFAPRVYRIEQRQSGDGAATLVTSTLLVSISTAVMLGITFGALKAYCAPKLFLLEKIAAMLKGMS